MALACEFCGKPLERGKRGPVRRFCSPAHAAEGRKVIPLEPGAGEVSRAAQRVVAEARKRRDVDALDDHPGAAARDLDDVLRDFRSTVRGTPA